MSHEVSWLSQLLMNRNAAVLAMPFVLNFEWNKNQSRMWLFQSPLPPPNLPLVCSFQKRRGPKWFKENRSERFKATRRSKRSEQPEAYQRGRSWRPEMRGRSKNPYLSWAKVPCLPSSEDNADIPSSFSPKCCPDVPGWVSYTRGH